MSMEEKEGKREGEGTVVHFTQDWPVGAHTVGDWAVCVHTVGH